MDYYYNIMEDIEAYPEAWCYIVFGGRNTGKTYSTLKGAVENGHTFVYVKRTVKDVQLICAGMRGRNFKNMAADMDLSPFKSINRDTGWNIRAVQIFEGLGAFFECDEDGNPSGHPIGYILALSAISKFKGFDLSECDWLIFDEFVPKIYDRVLRGEGEELLDLYKTIGRDREHRGQSALKLICLANADNASSAVTNTLEITDQIVRMSMQTEAFDYDEERGILVRRLIDNLTFKEREAQSKIYKAMKDTNWGRMALDNEFGFNDFSNVQKINLKGCRPMYSFKHKEKWSYVYLHDDTGTFYVTRSKFNQKLPVFDLNKENDQKRFYIDRVIDLRAACIDGRCVFSSYSLYDLIINYNKFYNV